MAIITTNGATRALGRGVTRRFVLLSDISTAQTLAPSPGPGLKRKIVGGKLWFTGMTPPVAYEIKSGSTPLDYGKPSADGELSINGYDEIVSDAAAAITIEADGPVDVDGWVDYIDGVEPSSGE